MSTHVYHPSEYKDDHIAFWLIAYVHKLDTHAKWSAKWHCRRDDGGTETSDWLFRNYTCDASVLHEFVKRGLVLTAEKAVTEHILDWSWEELEETVKSCQPMLSIALSDEAEEHHRKYRRPNENLWFEVVIDTFTDESVRFSMSLWAYKYSLPNLALPKQLYYLFADRLDAKIRFVHEWFALESAARQIEHALHRGKLLAPIEMDLRHELSLLRAPTDSQIQSSCRSLFPLLERAMREHIEGSLGGRKAGTLDDLIRRFESAKTLSQDTIELLRFVMKPKRDYIEHGRTLPTTAAKLVLITILEILGHLGDVDA